MLRPACLNRVRLRADAHNQIPLQRFCTKRLRPCYNQNVVQSLPLRKRTSVVRPAAVALTAGAPVPSPRTKALPFLSTRFDEEVLAIAVPALASMLLEPVMGVFNSALVSRLGTQQLGAVSVASLSMSFCTFLFSFLLFLTTPEIAAAVVKGERAEVSRISAKGFWVAGFFGLVSSITMWLGGPWIIGVMNPPEAEVKRYAVEYIRARAPGVLAALLGFVATGTYRGWKDTKTPLYAAVGSAATSLALNYVFIYVLGMGVFGSGLATTIAQYVSCGALCVLLVHKDMLRLQDLIRPPSFSSVLPMLRKGLVLAVRNVISFGMILYASTLCVRAGSAYQASFEVVRQVWILTIQFFECLNVAAQTLCSAYLGGGDVRSADEVLQRLLFLGVCMGGLVGLVVAACQTQIAAFFTQDVAVVTQVLLTMPMVAALFPVDAAASIMDGSLLAAKQTDYLSFVQILGSVVQYFALIWLAANARIENLTIWGVLKLLTVFRLGGGWYRNYHSPLSAYKARPKESPPAPTQPAISATTSHPTDGGAGPAGMAPSASDGSRGSSSSSSSNDGDGSSSSSSSSRSGGIGAKSFDVQDPVRVMSAAVEDPAASVATVRPCVSELEQEAGGLGGALGKGQGHDHLGHAAPTAQGGTPAAQQGTVSAAAAAG